MIFHDNDFEVFLDPDGDGQNYFELEINALNTVWDLRLPKAYRAGGSAINEWDIAGLRTAVLVDGALNDPLARSKGWSVEIAIPWAALSEHAGCVCPPRFGDQWRINFSRVEWRVDEFLKKLEGPEDNWVWSPQWAVDMHRPEFWGYLQFEATSRPSFRRDPDWDARVRLSEAWYRRGTMPGYDGPNAVTQTIGDAQVTLGGAVRFLMKIPARGGGYVCVDDSARYWGES